MVETPHYYMNVDGRSVMEVDPNGNSSLLASPISQSLRSRDGRLALI